MNRLIALCLLLAVVVSAVLIPGKWRSVPTIPATPRRALSPIRALWQWSSIKSESPSSDDSEDWSDDDADVPWWMSTPYRTVVFEPLDGPHVPEIFETIERFAMPSADFTAFERNSMFADWVRSEPCAEEVFVEAQVKRIASGVSVLFVPTTLWDLFVITHSESLSHMHFDSDLLDDDDEAQAAGTHSTLAYHRRFLRFLNAHYADLVLQLHRSHAASLEAHLFTPVLMDLLRLVVQNPFKLAKLQWQGNDHDKLAALSEEHRRLMHCRRDPSDCDSILIKAIDLELRARLENSVIFFRHGKASWLSHKDVAMLQGKLGNRQPSSPLGTISEYGEDDSSSSLTGVWAELVPRTTNNGLNVGKLEFQYGILSGFLASPKTIFTYASTLYVNYPECSQIMAMTGGKKSDSATSNMVYGLRISKLWLLRKGHELFQAPSTSMWSNALSLSGPVTKVFSTGDLILSQALDHHHAQWIDFMPTNFARIIRTLNVDTWPLIPDIRKKCVAQYRYRWFELVQRSLTIIELTINA